MHVKVFLHKLLDSVMHLKRLDALILMVMAALSAKRLSLTSLGRSLDSPISERSGIQKANRFLGNHNLHAERVSIAKATAHLLVGNKLRPSIIVDWSAIPNTTKHVLRASLVSEGRALTIYEEVHPESKLGNMRVQKALLKKIERAACF